MKRISFLLLLCVFLAETPGTAQPGVIGPVVFSGAGLNDASSGGIPTGAAGNYSFTIIVDGVGSPNTFKWQVNGGTFTTGVHMTGVAQLLEYGVTIKFAAITGHTLADAWTIMDNANGSLAAVNFIGSGVGAVFRSAQAKARDSVSILDFGAICDGSTDNTEKIQNALNSNPAVLSTSPGVCLTGPLTIPTQMTLNVVSGSTLELEASSSGDLLTVMAPATVITGGGTLDGNAAAQSASLAYPGMGVIRVAADNVNISGGLTVQNGYQYGIWAWVQLSENQNIAYDRSGLNVNGITVIEPVSSLNAPAISGNLAHGQISNNTLTAPGDGVGLQLPHDNTITGNVIDAGRIGVELFAGSTCNAGGVNGCSGYEPLGYNNSVGQNTIYVDPALYTGSGDFAMGVSFSGVTGCSSHGNVITLNPSYSGANVYAGHEIASGNPINGASNNNTISGGSINGAFPAAISIDTSFSNTITGVTVNDTFQPASSGVAHNYGAVHLLGPQNVGLVQGQQGVIGNVISGLTISVTGWMPCYSWQPLGPKGINNNTFNGGSCTGDLTSGGTGAALNQYLGASPTSPATGNTISNVAFINLDTAVWNDVGNPITSAFVYGNTFLGVNLPYGGEPSGYSVSPLDARQPAIVFTPTSTGWYRIASSSAASLGGVVRVLSSFYDNTITDIEFEYDMPGYGTNLGVQVGSITQLRYSDYNSGAVSQARVSNDGGANVYLDIFVSTAVSPQPLTIEFIGGNLNLPTGAVLAPVAGATPGSAHSYTLTFGLGLNTTGPISGSFLQGIVQPLTSSFGGLPTIQGPDILWCSDCTIASPCAGGGTGAYAFVNNFNWNCPF